MCIGNGLPAIPKKVHEKIVNWEYVKLAELRPAGTLDTLNRETEAQKYIIMPGLEITRANHKPIKDISTWVQCFAVYLAALCQQHPSAIQEMLAYMLIIIRAAQEFEDQVWRSYDKTFREKAAATGNKKWSEIDTHIYNQLFTGHARKVAICKHCNATNHSSDHCPSKTHKRTHEDSDDNPPMTKRIVPGSVAAAGGQGRNDICYLFNRSGSCRYGDLCRYRHMCSSCLGRHPRIMCMKGKRIPAIQSSFKEPINKIPPPPKQ